MSRGSGLCGNVSAFGKRTRASFRRVHSLTSSVVMIDRFACLHGPGGGEHVVSNVVAWHAAGGWHAPSKQLQVAPRRLQLLERNLGQRRHELLRAPEPLILCCASDPSRPPTASDEARPIAACDACTRAHVPVTVQILPVV